MTNKRVTRCIANQFKLYMGLLICAILVGIGLLGFGNVWLQKSYQSEITLLDQKSSAALAIQQSMNGAVPEFRGYLAYQDPQYVGRIKAKQANAEQAIQRYLNLKPLTAEDEAFVTYQASAYRKFFNQIVPSGMQLIQEKQFNGAAVQTLQQQEVSFTDQFRLENNNFLQTMDNRTTDLRNRYNRENDWLVGSFVAYLILIAVSIGYLAVRFAKGIGQPLRLLAFASQKDQEERIRDLPYDERQDEIGYLTKSLKSMVERMQTNERRLIEQNDELQAQQEELISQQDELFYSLQKMQEHEELLEAQNRLNSSLVNTMDRNALLQSIIENLLQILIADIGAVVLLEAGYPCATVGIRPEMRDAFVATLADGILTRVVEEKRTIVVARDATAADKGYHEEMIKIYDLYVPILSHDGVVIAMAVLTRLGRPFHSESHVQAMALAKQIALSIEKLHTYEASERDRVLNQEIIDSIREGIQLFDEHGFVQQVNQTWASWVNFDFQALSGEEATAAFFASIREQVLQAEELILFIQNALQDKDEGDEKQIYQLRGEQETIIQVYYEKIYDPRGIKRGTVLVHRDITREHEVDRMKSEFVSTVSHELRTPLTSVLGFSELMMNKELSPDRREKYVTTIYSEAKRLTQLINDFLDIQRMEAGQQSYRIAHVDLLRLAQEVLDQWGPNTPNHRLQMATAIPAATILADEDKIRQVLMNLLGNAVKYSPGGGDVWVTVRETEWEIIVDVADQGLGIPKEAIGKLFSKFYRIDNSDRRKIGGTGLGLSISQEIMKAHGGTISVDSELGAGSVFHLHFPKQGALERKQSLALV